MPSASALLIFLPTTSRSRSRRTTSTSGSSGIGPSVGMRTGRFARLVLQPCPRLACGRLFGGLLRAPLAGAVDRPAQLHLREELLRMVRPFVTDAVARQLV